MHNPTTEIQAEFEINRAVRYQTIEKKKNFTDDRRTDGVTDGRTDSRRVRQQLLPNVITKLNLYTKMIGVLIKRLRVCWRLH